MGLAERLRVDPSPPSSNPRMHARTRQACAPHACAAARRSLSLPLFQLSSTPHTATASPFMTTTPPPLAHLLGAREPS